MARKLTHDDYVFGWISPLEVEQVAALEMLEESHESLPTPTDHNVYDLGSIDGKNVAVAGVRSLSSGKHLSGDSYYSDANHISKPPIRAAGWHRWRRAHDNGSRDAAIRRCRD